MLKVSILKESNIFKKLLVGIIFAFFLSLYHIDVMNACNYNDIDLLFMLSYGNLDIDSIKYIIPIFFLIIPQLYLIFVLKDYLYIATSRNAIYVFTRNNSKSSWLLNKLVHLFIYVMIYYLIQFITVFLIGFFYGFTFNHTSIIIIGIEYILIILLNYFYILILNIMSLSINITYSFFITISVSIFQIFTIGFLYAFHFTSINLIKLFPISQAIIPWHTSHFIKYTDFFQFKINNFMLIDSMLYLLIICTSSIIYAIYNFKNMDII